MTEHLGEIQRYIDLKFEFLANNISRTLILTLFKDPSLMEKVKEEAVELQKEARERGMKPFDYRMELKEKGLLPPANAKLEEAISEFKQMILPTPKA